MKKHLLTAILFLLGISVFSQNHHASGEQYGEWVYDTIFVNGNVKVPDGKILTIYRGAKILFTGHYSIDIQGCINAAGTLNDSIFFTVSDTTGFYNDTISAGGWNSINISGNNNSATFEYCHFSDGKAFSDFNKDICGGALRIGKSKSVEIHHCTFKNNKAYLKGGAIYAEQSMINITDCDFIDNKMASVATPTFQYGGGCLFYGCDVNFHRNRALRNNCINCYGSGACFDSCNFNLRNSYFLDNAGALAGGLGVIRCNRDYSNITNTVIANNYALFFGGGMTASISTPILNNVSIINNVCDMGGGIQVYGGAHPTFNNCIFYGNRGQMIDTMNYGSQVFVLGEDNSCSFSYCYIEGGKKWFQYPPEAALIYDNIIESGDPQFVDIQNYNFRLTENSLCRDAGTPDTTGLFLPSYDMDMNRRVSNGRIDMGAYEFSGTGVNEQLHKAFNFNVMPNPVDESSVCRFTLDESGEVYIRIFDVNGKVAGYRVFELTNGEQEIKISDIIKGKVERECIYFIEMRCGGGENCVKVLIQ